MSKDELRKHSLMEIFYFYSKQHNYGKTFETKFSTSRFCVEFKILVKMKKLVELFKKNSTQSKQMDFNEEKKQYIESREKLYLMKLDEIDEEEKKKNKFNQDIKKEEKKEEDNEENENKQNENKENEKENNEENKKKKEENSENEEKKEKKTKMEIKKNK
jgi:hypothetical protein